MSTEQLIDEYDSIIMNSLGDDVSTWSLAESILEAAHSDGIDVSEINVHSLEAAINDSLPCFIHAANPGRYNY